MPVMNRSLVVRGYELNREGVVPAVTLMRYLEAMRWEAANDPELDFGFFFTGGNRLIVRAQKLEVLGAAHVGEELEISTWVSRVGRTSIDVAHRVWRPSDGAQIARGSVVAVQLGPEGMPHPVPERARGLLTEGDLPQVGLETGPRPATAFSLPLVIRPSDIDLFQHVNQAHYAAFFEDARFLAAQAGVYGEGPFGRKPLRGLAIDYRREVRVGDEIAIFTWALQQDPHVFAFELARSGESEPLVRARLEVEPSGWAAAKMGAPEPA